MKNNYQLFNAYSRLRKRIVAYDNLLVQTSEKFIFAILFKPKNKQLN
jgi:hypothetical protein